MYMQRPKNVHVKTWKMYMKRPEKCTSKDLKNVQDKKILFRFVSFFYLKTKKINPNS